MTLDRFTFYAALACVLTLAFLGLVSLAINIGWYSLLALPGGIWGSFTVTFHALENHKRMTR